MQKWFLIAKSFLLSRIWKIGRTIENLKSIFSEFPIFSPFFKMILQFSNFSIFVNNFPIVSNLYKMVFPIFVTSLFRPETGCYLRSLEITANFQTSFDVLKMTFFTSCERRSRPSKFFKSIGSKLWPLARKKHTDAT